MRLEIMDTTLRDGEQTSGVSFAVQEKLSIAKFLIEEVCVDRIEIASARVSDGENLAVHKIAEWASKKGYLDKIEVLGFVDDGVSLRWIKDAGCKVINLLTKGSERHCRLQLRKTPEQHIADIKRNIAKAQEMGITVNIYLEDWSNGIKDSKDYVFNMVEALKNEPIKRFMLPDTLGILNPYNTFDYCKEMCDRYPELHFDFHGHNDYDLAVANSLAAVKAGIKAVHTTVNGMGERAGNAPLSSIVAVIKDQTEGFEISVNEDTMNQVSRMVETYSGIHIPYNKPIVGENVFTQCAGVHADGDSKNNLYFNDLLPERFGRRREYALGKTSGKANIRKNLESLGIELDDESMTKVTQRIIELGDKKEIVTTEDLPYIISDVLKQDKQESIKILNYSLSLTQGLKPVATLKIEINGKQYEESSTGDGQYDAFVAALRKIYSGQLGREFPMLTNYTVSIPPGGRTDAFVQTAITWNYKNTEFKTRGLDADQTEAAIKATIKMLNKIETM